MRDNFFNLTPDIVLNAVEAEGFQPNGYLTQLNSYENRVFSVELEDNKKVIAKFYRPGRWLREAILDEHKFIVDLKMEGIPAAAALSLSNGTSVSKHSGMLMSLFERIQGRSPDEFLPGDLEKIGRRLAQLHNVGARVKAKHRWNLHPRFLGWPSLQILESFIVPELINRYMTAAEDILEFLEDELYEEDFIRIHGDCHKGNLINDSKEFFFVDFDDLMNGLPVQDIWMLTQGDEEETKINVDELLKGYCELRDFDDSTLALIEPLRALRMIYYSAWIAKRWTDPSFPKLFPNFSSHNYWLEEVDNLEKVARKL
ncbi:MAG: serine/threonine protein kinase [Bdellovibrionales bacterium]